MLSKLVTVLLTPGDPRRALNQLFTVKHIVIAATTLINSVSKGK